MNLHILEDQTTIVVEFIILQMISSFNEMQLFYCKKNPKKNASWFPQEYKAAPVFSFCK